MPVDIWEQAGSRVACLHLDAQLRRARGKSEHDQCIGLFPLEQHRQLLIDHRIADAKHVTDAPETRRTALPCEFGNKRLGRIEWRARKGTEAGDENDRQGRMLDVRDQRSDFRLADEI